jgi:hypothetical protein
VPTGTLLLRRFHPLKPQKSTDLIKLIRFLVLLLFNINLFKFIVIMLFQKTLIFRTLGILAASFSLASCSFSEQSKKESPAELVKKQAGKFVGREITIPLEKPKPAKNKLPDSITATQPVFELKEQETKGFRFTVSARGVDVRESNNVVLGNMVKP